jgi:adenosylcobinamide-GDP ribazoletransferase
LITRAKNLLAFLTIMPVGMNSDYLKDAAQLMYLFPLVGALIGLPAGLLAVFLGRFLPAPLVGLLSLAFILLFTGLHHTDGLLDFGDGLMCAGTPEKKIAAMHDLNTGTGGLMLGLVTILITATAIGALHPSVLLVSLVASETFAKFAMTLEAWIGRSAHEGMNTRFVGAMHDRWRYLRLGFALATSAAISLILPGLIGLLSLAAVVLTTFVLVWISNRHFDGVTGDVFGATNDLARMVSLLALVVVS